MVSEDRCSIQQGCVGKCPVVWRTAMLCRGPVPDTLDRACVDYPSAVAGDHIRGHALRAEEHAFGKSPSRFDPTPSVTSGNRNMASTPGSN
jgi:hypothetical protein